MLRRHGPTASRAGFASLQERELGFVAVAVVRIARPLPLRGRLAAGGAVARACPAAAPRAAGRAGPPAPGGAVPGASPAAAPGAADGAADRLAGAGPDPGGRHRQGSARRLAG